MLLPKKPRDTVSKRPDRQANASQSASTMHCTAARSQGYQRQAALPKMNRLLCKGCKLCRISASQVEKVIRLTVTVVFSERIQPLCNTARFPAARRSSVQLAYIQGCSTGSHLQPVLGLNSNISSWCVKQSDYILRACWCQNNEAAGRTLVQNISGSQHKLPQHVFCFVLRP